jgi:hypothetical protein
MDEGRKASAKFRNRKISEKSLTSVRAKFRRRVTFTTPEHEREEI